MSNANNIFEQVLNDAEGVQNKLLGPSYPYYKNIKTPSEIGMSDKGTTAALGNDIDGLINYVKLLVDGTGKASSTGQPLGNKFFLNTGAKCLDKESNTEVDRYIYVDNVPDGSIPFISQGMGVNFSQFRGLIPGAISDLNVLNPYAIMQSFLSGSTPQCQKLTMQTIDVNNNKSSETHYVTLIDIQNMNSCSFPERKNPISGKPCRQAFNTLSQVQEVNENEHIEQLKLPQDPLAQIYFLSLSALVIYIFYKLIEKSK
jgi:hypothetical protein